MSRYHEVTKIHQVLVVDGGELPNVIPTPLQSNIDRIKAIYPKAEYKLWSNNEIRSFLEENFEEEVLWAYDTLKPYAYKCDLARYCILYIYGGLYIDLALKIVNKWNIPINKNFAAFGDDPFFGRRWAKVQNCLLWATPLRKEFRIAINLIIDNCQKQYYGSSFIHITGPVLLGYAYSLVRNNRVYDQYMGQSHRILGATARISHGGDIVALTINKIAGDISHLNISGSNNYIDMWRQRRVYGEKESVWYHNDYLLLLAGGTYRTRTGIAIKKDINHSSIYGPYCYLRSGRYKLKVIFSEDTKFSQVKLRVSFSSGVRTIFKKKYRNIFFKKCSEIECRFKLKHDVDNVEFILSNFVNFSGSFLKYILIEY